MQNSQITNQKVTDKKSDNSNIFDISIFERRIQKTENILSAILLVTSSLKNENSDTNQKAIYGLMSKNKNQDKSLQFLVSKIEESVYMAANNFYNSKENIKDNLQSIVFYINSLKLQNAISDDNHMSLIIAYSTVISAYEHVENSSLEANNNLHIKDIDLKLEDIEDEYGVEDFIFIKDKSHKKDSEDKKEIKEIKDNKFQSINFKKLDSVILSNAKNIKDSATTYPSQVTSPSRAIRQREEQDTFANKRQDSRRNEILKLLSDNPVTIKDISEKVLGCSEKTIQRELNSMLDDSVILRIGEKRWSKYVLA